MIEQIRVIFALLRRDIFVLRKALRDDLINSIVKVSVMFFVLGVLSPYFGFTPMMSRNVMIGAIVTVFLSRGFVCGVTDSFDLSQTRFIDYKRTLPLSTSGLLLAMLCNYVLTLMASSLPLFILAKLYLGSRMPLGDIQWIYLIIIYLASMIFISAFFLNVILISSFEWFRFNIWQRVLIPMNSFGCFMFSWKRLFAFSPLLARAILVNPFVYIAEGLRAAVFGNQEYIPVYYCAPMVCFWAAVAVWILVNPVRKRVESSV